jgi:hypothetical protein
MMLRLALVGIVAALGVTLPSQTDCDHWLLSSERWVSSVLADWDTWTPREHAAGTDLVATTDHECEQCRLARLELARSEESAVGSTVTESVPTVASSPVVIVEKRSDRPDRASLAPTESNRLSTFDPVAFTMDFDAESAVKLDDDVKGLGVAEALGRLTALDAHAEWAELAERLELALPDQVWEAALHEENTLVRWRPVATDPTQGTLSLVPLRLSLSSTSRFSLRMFRRHPSLSSHPCRTHSVRRSRTLTALTFSSPSPVKWKHGSRKDRGRRSIRSPMPR